MLGKILLVEDDRDIREALVDILELEGFEVLTAVDGQDALDQLRRMPAPKLVLLDLTMPVKDGIQFRTEQLADPTLCDIPVIIMSADHNIESKARQLNVKGYVKKPLEIELFLMTLKRLCD